jgi:ubiquinone/menaquinone biosynthesis C-methylase UbiE
MVKVDLNWNDSHVIPVTAYPDLEFLFSQMTNITLKRVDSRPGEKIVDVGCGRALDALKLALNGAEVIGVEPSKVMLDHAKARSNGKVALVQAVAEYLPLAENSIDKVVCKGALDHFSHPGRAMEEFARVMKVDGEVIISLFNFSSLGFRMGRMTWKILRRGSSVLWEPPSDHTYKFDYKKLKTMAEAQFKVKSAQGVSIMYGAPWWGKFLARLPHGASSFILSALDRIARYLPSLADVTVLRLIKK